jgi:hypothetical protein
MTIKATHNGQESVRKPDIVAVSLNDARRAFGSGDTASWDEYAFNTAVDQPKDNFEWEHPFFSAEFKLKNKQLDPPPESYSLEPVEPIEPQRLPEERKGPEGVEKPMPMAPTPDDIVESSNKPKAGKYPLRFSCSTR